MSEIACIIPHYGPQDLLDRCLESLQPSVPLLQPIVHDNNKNNVLFTHAINEGIKTALKMPEIKLIMLLNNDCVFPDINASIRAVAQCLTDIPGCGIVGPKNLSMENPDFIFWGGSRQAFPTGKHKQGHVSKGELNQRTEEEWITFSCAFLRPEMVVEVGLLDKNMRHIASDSDYCFRARMQGWKCIYEPNAVVHHAVGSSMRGAAGALQGVMRNDVTHFHKKWIGGLYPLMTRYA